MIYGDLRDQLSEISYILSWPVACRSSSIGKIALNTVKANGADPKFLELNRGIFNHFKIRFLHFILMDLIVLYSAIVGLNKRNVLIIKTIMYYVIQSQNTFLLVKSLSIFLKIMILLSLKCINWFLTQSMTFCLSML